MEISWRNCMWISGLKYYSSENFRSKFYEIKNFVDSSLHRIFESENFRFSFSKKNSLTWRMNCEKLNFRKS